METSVIDKIVTIFNYLLSSFMSIELFIIIILLFSILFFVMKSNNKFIRFLFSLIFILFLSITIICFNDYASGAVNYFIKMLMQYYYFPSMAIYFIIVLFVSILFIMCVLFNVFPKIVRKSIFILTFFIYLFFVEFLSFIVSNNIKLTMDVSIYSNTVVLALVQLSNLLVLIWILFIFFYRLYVFFRKKFD